MGIGFSNILNRYSFILIILTLWMSSCQSEKERRQVMIEGMEKAVSKNTSDEFVRPLVANYIQYTTDYLNDPMNPYYLYQAAVLYFRVGNQSEAIIQLERIIREHPECEIIEDVYLTLGMMCATGGFQQERAKEIYQLYTDRYPEGKGIKQIELFYAPPIERVRAKIADLQTKLKESSKLGIYNKEISNQLLWSFIDFIKLDSTQQDLRFQYCLQGAQLAIRSGLHLVAIELLDHLIQNDTDKERISKGMFLLANEYAKEITSYLTVDPLISSSINERIDPVTIHKIDHLNKADQLYRKLIESFADSPYGRRAEEMIRNQ